MGYILHQKHSLPALQQSAIDNVEALQLRQGMEAGMASDVAATEEFFGDNSFSNLLAKGEDLTNHDDAYQCGFGFVGNRQYLAILFLEEGKPERDSSMPATPSDLDFDANRRDEQVCSIRLSFELGTSSSSIGDQKPGPQETFSNVNLDACVTTASMSWHASATKPIWDEGIGSIIFGDGILLESVFCSVECYEPDPSTCLESRVEQPAECRREMKRSMPESVSDSCADVARHTPGVKWQEESESTWQSALKRWLVVVFSFDRGATVWRQLAAESEAVGKILVPSDLFRGKAPATLLKRVKAVGRFCQFLGGGCLPAVKASIYRFFQHERSTSAPPSRLRSCLEAITSCYHVLSMAELKEAVTSKRLHGCTVAEIPGGGTQASLLTLDDLCRLRTILRARWLQVRKSLSVAEPLDHPLMLVPSVQSAPTTRPLSASETGKWLRKILFGEKERLPGRRVPAHSMKATMLSLAAKFGLDAGTKLQWAYHVGGFKLLHTCSRDAAAQPLLQLESVLKVIREETLRPDSMRSGRFVCQPVEKEPELSSFTVMDLTAEVELSGVMQGRNSNQRGGCFELLS